MIIGIDASRALRPNPTGTEQYALAIIRHLLARPGDHTFRLYLPAPVDAGHALIAGARADVEQVVLPPTRAWTHRRLAAALRRHAPDVYFVPAHVLPMRWPPLRVPGVVTIHDLGYLHLPAAHTAAQRAYLNLTTRYAARYAARLIAVSHATAADLVAAYAADPACVRVIHEAAIEQGGLAGAAAVSADALRARYDLRRPYALFMGTLQPRKNLLRLAQAYARLVRAGLADFDLVLAGAPGWKSDPLYAGLAALELGDALRLPGYIPAADAPALLHGARVFCYPSLFEGFGLPVLEAQQAGVPVLTANNSSLPEVAGDAAILVDADDVDAIAAAMLQLSRDEALRARLIAAGHENVKRFSWQKAAAQTLAVLEEAARSR